jgi:hypothetical protein
MSINTPVGIVKELLFDLPQSMVPSVKKELRVQPYGQSSFSNAGQVAQIVIPQMQRSFLQTDTGYITGTVAFTGVTGTVDLSKSYVLGSFYSLFSRQVIRSNTQILETIDQPGRVVNSILNMSLNPAEKMGLSNSFGFYVTDSGQCLGNIGPIINSTLGSTGTPNLTQTQFTFSIPLIGCMNTSKFWPCFLGETTIELTLASLGDFLVNAFGSTVSGFSISNLEYVCETIELSPESYNMVMANYPSQLVLKTESYVYGSNSLPASSGAGSYDLPFQAKLNSLKRIIWYASPANAIDLNFGGVNPNLDSWQFVTNGTSYPQRPIKAWNPSEAYNQMQKAQGALYSLTHSGCANRNSYCVASTATYGSIYPYWRAYDSALTTTELEVGGNKFYNCLDVEVVNQNKDSLYTGISTSGTSSFLRLNIASALSASVHTIQWWANHDKLIVFDLVTQEIRSIE